MSYKLSHTAQEVDDKLKRIEEGGTGYTEDETIHPIDPKFLPGVCLPVVELTTMPADHDALEANPLTADENAMMNEVTKTGMPFVLKYAGTSGNVTIILQVIEQDGTKMAFSVTDIVPVTMFGVNGEWSIRYQE